MAAGDVLARLWQLTQAVLDAAAPDLERLGLNIKGFFVLNNVKAHPFPAELARLLYLPPPSVTYLVKQLEEKGFLRREVEAGDFRKFRLTLTAAGREARRRGGAAVNVVFAARLRRLADDDVARLDRMLTALIPAVGAAEPPHEDGP